MAKTKARTRAKPPVTRADRNEAVRLRLDGFDVSAIATELELTQVQVRKIFRDLTERQNFYELEMLRIAQYERDLHKVATTDITSEQGARAVDTLLKLWARRREMLNAKNKIDKTATDEYKAAKAEQARFRVEREKGEYISRDKARENTAAAVSALRTAEEQIMQHAGADAARPLTDVLKMLAEGG